MLMHAGIQNFYLASRSNYGEKIFLDVHLILKLVKCFLRASNICDYNKRILVLRMQMTNPWCLRFSVTWFSVPMLARARCDSWFPGGQPLHLEPRGPHVGGEPPHWLAQGLARQTPAHPLAGTLTLALSFALHPFSVFPETQGLKAWT